MALPVEGDPGPLEAIPVALPLPMAEPAAGSAPTDPDLPVLALSPPAAPTAFPCPACGTEAPAEQVYCSDCGYYFSDSDLAARASQGPPAGPLALPAAKLRDRYELKARLAERCGVERFHALDHAATPPAPVVVVRQPLPPPPPEAPPLTEAEGELTDEILPSFDDPEPAGPGVTQAMPAPDWPSIAWERRLLHSLANPALPAELDHFTDETHEYLVLEVPQGTLLWDAWDDPDAGAAERFGYLAQVAEALHRLHQGGALLEGLRPDIVVVQDGRARITDLSDLLPLPFPPGTPVRGTLYTAPELLAGHGVVDARADLYSFGAMLYALHVGSELNENRDFDGPGNPKPFIPRFCDIHPAFGRLMMKTFRKEVEARFPTDEAKKDDPTGFTDLIRTLETLQRTFDNVRLDVASWTSTGIVRTGNEDAFCVLHAAESRQDDLGEAALVILCDGMGGYAAGEVAAAMTIQHLRQGLTRERPFSVAAGASPFLTDPQKDAAKPEGHAGPPVDVDAVKQAIKAALRDANKAVFQASRAPGSKRRGMGCTAEVVYVDGRHVVVGHVGDSRTYHLHEGRLIQLTRDQTLVNRLVELGTLSAEEAETHPRRNELQQAIGGQPDVDPGLYHGRMSPGDWVVVCSDGLTNHVTARDLQQMLQSEATSAEMAARRLVNLTLIEGATDNVTVVAIRAT
jgi:serine/threonine protein phosphatase PrpC